MKRRFKRLASLLLTVTMLAANVPVYAAGYDGAAGVNVTAVEETGSNANASEDENGSNAGKTETGADKSEAEAGKTEKSESENVDEIGNPSDADSDANAPGSEDVPAVEEADMQDGEFHDISDCCTIVDNVITSYTGDYEKISIPEGVTGIEVYVFYNKKELQEVKWPSSLKTIGNLAFQGDVNLKSSDLSGTSLTLIGESAFQDCTSLPAVKLPTANKLILQANAFYNTAMNDGTEDGEVIIPANVTTVGSGAFSNCTNLKSVVFAEGTDTVTLGYSVFAGSSHLESIKLSERVKEIKYGFAYGCDMLTEVTWPKALTTIESYTFTGDKRLVSADLSATSLTSIGEGAFKDCTMLPIVKLPEKNKLTIAEYAFQNTMMSDATSDGELVIPANVIQIKGEAFQNCTNLGSVVFAEGSGTITLSGSIFYGDPALTSIILSERVESIPNYFASGCTVLEEVKWSKALKQIGIGAFQNDIVLTSGDLSDTSLNKIDVSAFEGCSILPLVKLPTKNKLEIAENAFKYTSMKNGNASGELVIPENVNSIGAEAFCGCVDLGSVVIENGSSILTMGNSPFYADNKLTKISLSDRVRTIPYGFACECGALTEVVWPEQLTDIGPAAFYNDGNLISSDLSKTSLTKIEYSAFEECKALPLVKLPEKSKLIIEDKAFNRTSMKDGDKDGELTIPENVSTIGQYAFCNCSNLGSVVFADGSNIITVSSYVFGYDHRLTKITFSDRVRSIPELFAVDTPALIEINGGSKVSKVEKNAFWIADKCELVLTGNCSDTLKNYNWAGDNRIVVSSAASIVFPQDTYTVEVKGKLDLKPVITVIPKGAVAPKLIWKSENSDVVSVDNKGVVTGIKETSGIRISVETEEGIAKGSVMVAVVKKGTKPDPGPDPDPGHNDPIPGGKAPTDPQPDISSTTTALTLVKGQKFMMADKDWKSRNKNVSAKKGKIVAKKAGEGTIYRPGQTIALTIVQPYFEAKSVKMAAGTTKQMELKGTSGLPVLYYSSAPDVAVVDQDGNISAIAKGKAVIMTYCNGVLFKCKVSVADWDTSKVDFTKNVELAPLQTVTVKAPGFKAKNASWTSDKTAKTELAKGVVFEDEVVRITGNGKLTAVGAGTTTLNATGGGTELKFTVTVAEPVVKTVHVNVGGKKTFKLSGAKKQPVWTVEDGTVASVINGRVTGAKAGNTVMTAQYENFSYTVELFVENPAPYKYTIEMKKGETREIMPAGLFQPFVFKSNKSHIAFADPDGKLEARTAGKAKLTAKINGKSVVVTVKVTD